MAERHFVQAFVEIPTAYRSETDAQSKADRVARRVKERFEHAETSVSIWTAENRYFVQVTVEFPTAFRNEETALQLASRFDKTVRRYFTNASVPVSIWTVDTEAI